MAEQKKLDGSYMSRILRLTLLAPDFIAAILDGRQPESCTLADLMEPLPMLWSEQRVRLGLPCLLAALSNSIKITPTLW